MEARASSVRIGGTTIPRWALGLGPLLAIILAATLIAVLGAPGLGERPGPPVEELAVESTVLRPGEIELNLRNEGPDAVVVEQVAINDAFIPFEATSQEVDRLGSEALTIPYPWIEGEAYEMFLLLSTGGTIEHAIDVAVETPEADVGFYGLMALLGIYVGVIPVALGMLWLPFVRRIPPSWIRGLLAFTVGLLAFLALDAWLEGTEIAEGGAAAFGGATLVFLGAAGAYLAMHAIDGRLRRRADEDIAAGATPAKLAFLVALGIGLHNLGEGIAIGTAYASGALALGAFLVIGFALHNTTEGLAIVAPLANAKPRFRQLAGLGLLAGAPAIFGAWIGAAVFSPALGALLFGIGVGAIVHVIGQLLPSVRDEHGALLTPATATAALAGLLALWATGLLIAV